VIQVDQKACQAYDQCIRCDERSLSDGSTIFLLFTQKVVKGSEKEDPCCQSPQEKIKGYRPVPYMKLRIDQQILSSADYELFFHYFSD